MKHFNEIKNITNFNYENGYKNKCITNYYCYYYLLLFH